MCERHKMKSRWQSGKTFAVSVMGKLWISPVCNIFFEINQETPAAKMIKNLPTMWETWIQSLGWEDPPGEGNGNPL